MKPLFILLVSSLALWLGGGWAADRLPAPSQLKSPVEQAPLQTDIVEGLPGSQPFTLDRHGHHYVIKPKAHYQISGVVVSLSDANSWRNITHMKVGDFINTRDLCVIWHENASNPRLGQFSFTHGDWTCYVQTHDTEAWRSFKLNELSNNHLLPATPEVADVLAKVRIGDQISISGQLVDYSTDGMPVRKTSLTRDDTGNGACEILYAKDIQILATGSKFWRGLEELGFYGTLLSVLVMIGTVLIVPLLGSNQAPN